MLESWLLGLLRIRLSLAEQLLENIAQNVFLLRVFFELFQATAAMSNNVSYWGIIISASIPDAR